MIRRSITRRMSRRTTVIWLRTGRSQLDDQVADPAVSPIAGSWTFTYFSSSHRLGDDASATPEAVYVTWDTSALSLGTGTQWAANAAYSVYEWIDGVKTLLTTVDVNQGAPPPSDSPNGADRPWKRLGVWNVTGWIEVDLSDGSSTTGDRLCVGDAMVHAIWPTISIRADLDGTGTYGLKDDFLATQDQFMINPEASGPRAKLELQAFVDPLYYDIPGATSDPWKALLPAVTGLQFWNSSSGGTPMSIVDSGGDVVNDSLVGGGNYVRTVYASWNPSYVATATTAEIDFILDPISFRVSRSIVAQPAQACRA